MNKDVEYTYNLIEGFISTISHIAVGLVESGAPYDQVDALFEALNGLMRYNSIIFKEKDK